MFRLARITEIVKRLDFVAIAVELLIVFIGVYLAFLLAQFDQGRRMDERRDRVLGLLKEGVVYYEELFSGFVLYHDSHNASFREDLDKGVIQDYADQTYVAPQYPIEVVNYLITSESFDVFDAELYLPLTSYANALERIMYVEEKLTELAEGFNPAAASSDDPVLRESQLQNAARYLRYMDLRRSISGELARKSSELLALIDD